MFSANALTLQLQSGRGATTEQQAVFGEPTVGLRLITKMQFQHGVHHLWVQNTKTLRLRWQHNVS